MKVAVIHGMIMSMCVCVCVCEDGTMYIRCYMWADMTVVHGMIISRSYM